jgi:hypothetical protein
MIRQKIYNSTFLLLGYSILTARIKFKTSGFSVLKKRKGKWGKWSDLDLVNILVS